MNGYCWNKFEHERQAERDHDVGRRDREMYERHSHDDCKRVYTERWDEEERRDERRRDEREEEERIEEAHARRQAEERREREYEEAVQLEYERSLQQQEPSA